MIQQWIAASIAERTLEYFTFGEKDSIEPMQAFLDGLAANPALSSQLTVGMVYKALLACVFEHGKDPYSFKTELLHDVLEELMSGNSANNDDDDSSSSSSSSNTNNNNNNTITQIGNDEDHTQTQ